MRKKKVHSCADVFFTINILIFRKIQPHEFCTNPHFLHECSIFGGIVQKI